MPIIMIENLLLLLAKGFLVTFVIIALLRSLSFKLGWVDNPGGRKKHKRAVPMIGGLAIFVGFSLAIGHTLFLSSSFLIFWLICSALVVLSGIDDLYPLRAGHRFMLHFILMMVMAILGKTAISNLGNLLGIGVIGLGWSGLIFTGIASVGIINAVNMMDGVDGLTACVSLVELSLLLFLSVHSHLFKESMIIVTFMGTIGAFLLFNFPIKAVEKYKVFLGDTGSMLIGFLLVWLCIRLTQYGEHSYPPALMLWIVALPLMDALHVMMNRKVRGVSPFKADRRHIHHICLRLGYTSLQVTCMLSVISFAIGIMGIVIHQQGGSEPLLFGGMVMMLMLYTCVVCALKKKLLHRKSVSDQKVGLMAQGIVTQKF